jgi:hypothetical protein
VGRTYLALLSAGFIAAAALPASAAERQPAWKSYENARFGFSVQYPQDWRLGDPLPDGLGVILLPPQPKIEVGLSGFLNVSEGTSQDGRQTLAEFSTAHHRIINDLHAKKGTQPKWEADHDVTLGGQPAKQLTFSYEDESRTLIIEMHIFSLGRNEGRGVRIKFPASARRELMPVMSRMLQTYQAGRDQNAVSPFVPRPE